ncbi:MAG TPA: hypothetical protein VMP01_08795 [Pirellulaceae bacterium]|nr:hypothetical protein [Pirellulaceae bacterium]
MALEPVLRYVILAEDWEQSHPHRNRINILGLLSSVDLPLPFPAFVPEMCCVVMLTECRGSGSVAIQCVFEETGRRVFGTQTREAPLGNDPLDIVIVPFRILECFFPSPGTYNIQFLFDGKVLGECPLRVR